MFVADRILGYSHIIAENYISIVYKSCVLFSNIPLNIGTLSMVYKIVNTKKNIEKKEFLLYATAMSMKS